MASIRVLARTSLRVARALAARPAQAVSSFMDEVDEVWMVDAFMDQPDPADAAN